MQPSAQSLTSAFIQMGEYALTHTAKPFPYAYSDKPNTQINQKLQTLWHNRVTLANLQASQEGLYILNIPFCPGNDLTQAETRWNHLTRIIRDESFGSTAMESASVVGRRLFVTIGINRPISICKEDNHAFWTWVGNRATNNLGFNCRVISTVWETTFANGADILTAQLNFLVLEYLDKELADRVKANSSLRKQIPFRYIREWILNDTKHQPTFENTIANRAFSYLNTVDADTVAFRSDGGSLFTTYDAMIAQSPQLPGLMSTGYYAPLNSPLVTEMAVIIDMSIRQGVSKHIPGGTYPPEPNTAVCLNYPEIRRSMSFRSKSSTLDTENRRLLSNIRPHLNQTPILIVAQRCLLTTIPERMEASKKRDDLTVKTIGQVQVIKALRGISQSHADAMLLGTNIFGALPFPQNSNKHTITRQKFNSYFSEILKAFDPISLTQSWPKGRAKYTYHCFLIMQQCYPLWRNSLLLAWENPQELNRLKDEWATSMEAIAKRVGEKRTKYKVTIGPQATTKKNYEDAFQAMFEVIRAKSEALVKEGHFSKELCNRLVKAAADAGDAIYEHLANIRN